MREQALTSCGTRCHEGSSRGVRADTRGLTWRGQAGGTTEFSYAPGALPPRLVGSLLVHCP
eukprot:1482638-Rhodomonas_salina.1